MADKKLKWVIIVGIAICTGALLYNLVIRPNVLERKLAECLSNANNPFDALYGGEVNAIRADICLRQYSR